MGGRAHCGCERELRKVEKRESRRKNDDGSGASLGIYSSARDFGIHAIGLPVAVADLESVRRLPSFGVGDVALDNNDIRAHGRDERLLFVAR